MIKLALKHWVLECCIQKIFESISSNFSRSLSRLTSVKHGQIFKYIIYLNGDGSRITKCWNAQVHRIFFHSGGFMVKGDVVHELDEHGDVVNIGTDYGNYLILYLDIIDYRL